MFKALTPIFAILVSVGLVVTHVQPSFLAIRSMERETDEYRNALEQASQLQARIDDKLNQRRMFDPADLTRLSQLIPTEVDQIGTILTLDSLARLHQMPLSGIEVVAPKEAGEGEDGEVYGAMSEEEMMSSNSDDPSLVGVVDMSETRVPVYTDISFAVEGTYEQFKDFMLDLEDSLALAEVMKLEFNADEGDLVLFNVALRFASYNSAE